MAVATSEDIRRQNLSNLLGLLYRQGSTSRAKLGRATGLNRSTIANLVADLVALGLVVESDPETAGRVGRPSPLVGIRPEVVAIAINPEVDALTIGLVGLDGQVRRVIRHTHERIPTAGEAISLAASIIAGMKGELAGLRLAGIGVAIPGQVRTADGLVRNAPHLGWRDEPFAEPLAALTGYPVWVANDAMLGALAEFHFGAGRGKRDLIYLNGGASGIGGGVISGAQLLSGASGHAGELGHIRVSGSDRLDSAGFPGTLEAEVSRDELCTALGVEQASPADFKNWLLADPSLGVKVIVERQLGHLGVAISSAVNIFNPEVVVLGGFLAALAEYDPERLQQVVRIGALPASLESIAITSAQLGENLLLVGAAGLAFTDLLADPSRAAG